MSTYRYIFGSIAILGFAVGSFFTWLSINTPDIADAATESLYADGTVSVSNSSCTTGNAHTTLDDDPDSPGGDWCNAVDNGTDHIIRITMPTPSGNPTTGTGAQGFRMYVRKSASGGGDPDMVAQLYCNNTNQAGAFILGTVTSDTGQLITGTITYPVGDCLADGSNVEIGLECSRSSGSPTSRRSCDMDAFEWVVDYTAGGGGGSPPVQQSEFFFE